MNETVVVFPFWNNLLPCASHCQIYPFVRSLTTSDATPKLCWLGDCSVSAQEKPVAALAFHQLRGRLLRSIKFSEFSGSRTKLSLGFFTPSLSLGARKKKEVNLSAIRSGYHKAVGQNTTRYGSVINNPQKQPVTYSYVNWQPLTVAESMQQLNVANSRQTEPIWIGASLFGILLIALIVLYSLYHRAARKQRKIQQQYDQLALLMKELHHRAKNNLAIVSSLLFLQANYLDDKEMVQEIRVIQQRVEAMLLIHQRLYLGNQTTIVNIREYLTDLAESLLKAYGHPLASFDLRLEIDLVDLDVDIAIPLGLLVNELLTNSFKYAYDVCHTPMLRIALHKVGSSKQGGILLEVQDNGPGIDMADWQKEGNRKSFGKKLISLLVQQLDGQFDLIKQEGTLFTLYIPHSPQSRLRA